MAGSKQPKSKMQRALDSGKDIKTDPPRVRSEVTGEGRSTCEAVLQTPAADWGGYPSTCTSYQLAIDSGSPTNPSGLKLCKNDMQNSRKCYCSNYNFTIKVAVQSASQDQPDEETRGMRSGSVLGMVRSCPQDGSPPSTPCVNQSFCRAFILQM